jgi:hypothetical protein
MQPTDASTWRCAAGTASAESTPGPGTTFRGGFLVLDRGPPDQWPDLYLRSQNREGGRRTRGFVAGDDWHGAIHSPLFIADKKAFNFGFFRWPQRWRIQVKLKDQEESAPAQLNLHQESRKNLGNWIVGGFAMSVVEGELIRNGEAIPVLGWAELIK